MIRHCRRELPFEGCGLLSGMNGQNETLWQMKSIVRSPVSFEMDMGEIKAVFDNIKERGESLTGIYHSHPTAAAYPSADDIANAHYPETAYFIVSFLHGAPVMKCFHIKNGAVIPLTIETY